MTPWQEKTATWLTPWTLAGGDFAATPAASMPITKLNAGKWVELDVTALVQKWVGAPATNLGALVKLSNETSFTKYRLASREYWDKAMVPVLEVTYKTAVP